MTEYTILYWDYKRGIESTTKILADSSQDAEDDFNDYLQFRFDTFISIQSSEWLTR